MQAITQYLKRQGYNVVDDSFYSQIALWFKWYKGKVSSFHGYRQYNGKTKVYRERKTLGMAKKIPEDWANLELNEKVEIVIDNEAVNEQIQAVLEANNFRVRANQLLELSFALGTGAFVEFKDGEDIKIDYIRAGMVYPLRWDNSRVIDCAFASERIREKEKLIYLNIHERRTDGTYTIYNRMFIRSGNSLTATDLPEGVAEEVFTESELPSFQIIRPNIVNNTDPDSPMGISVFANALDLLEGLDLIYDSYCNEFRLGKKRIVVPTSWAKLMMEEDGSMRQAFDDNDTEFYALPLGDSQDQKLQEINMELRADAHESAIKTTMNLLSAKCGLGNDRYQFDYHDTVKTATEVVSEKSELFQNLKKHEMILDKAIKDMIYAVASLLGIRTDFEVSVNFDDSIIEDTAAEKQAFLQEIRDGIRQPWEYRVEFFKEDEETARKMTAEASEGPGGFFDE